MTDQLLIIPHGKDQKISLRILLCRDVSSAVIVKNVDWALAASFMLEPISNTFIMKAAKTF